MLLNFNKENESIISQTKESINKSKAIFIPISIIAINKIDLPNSNIDKVLIDISK